MAVRPVRPPLVSPHRTDRDQVIHRFPVTIIQYPARLLDAAPAPQLRSTVRHPQQGIFRPGYSGKLRRGGVHPPQHNSTPTGFLIAHPTGPRLSTMRTRSGILCDGLTAGTTGNEFRFHLGWDFWGFFFLEPGFALRIALLPGSPDASGKSAPLTFSMMPSR